MVKPFEFATAGRILFGEGRCQELPALLKSQGARPLLVTGKPSARTAHAAAILRDFQPIEFFLAGEPDLESVQRGAELARQQRCDCVVGFGGGSAIDGAKAIAALATNPGSVLDYLEVIGKAQPLTADPLPTIAVPTTAGTGAEVTRNAVLRSRQHGVKASLRHPLLLPRLAIVDPLLTADLPPALTANTGLDALTQLIEAFVCQRANALVDGLCREAIPLAARSLPRAFANGQDVGARSEMSLASLFGGLALANAGLGAVHGFAAPIGGMFDAPHGAVCAALLADVMELNVAVASEMKASDVLARYCEVARLLTGNADASALDGINFVRGLTRALTVAPLGVLGISARDLSTIAQRAGEASSMKANPVSLSQRQLVEVLERAL